MKESYQTETRGKRPSVDSTSNWRRNPGRVLLKSELISSFIQETILGPRTAWEGVSSHPTLQNPHGDP